LIGAANLEMGAAIAFANALYLFARLVHHGGGLWRIAQLFEAGQMGRFDHAFVDRAIALWPEEHWLHHDGIVVQRGEQEAGVDAQPIKFGLTAVEIGFDLGKHFGRVGQADLAMHGDPALAFWPQNGVGRGEGHGADDFGDGVGDFHAVIARGNCAGGGKVCGYAGGGAAFGGDVEGIFLLLDKAAPGLGDFERGEQ